ncbi:DUF4434 domain-containing protein [Nonomuraea sp. NPDC000554]|uniref:DUF4434 domain-containing protein n=1 Tax=Nonomuraea sp. NPDC000554 TaxID=3154259 RepID=UPI00332779EC
MVGQRAGRVLRWVVAVAAVLGIVVPESWASARYAPGECPPPDPRVATPYPITGYWLVPRPDRCVTRRTVEAIHGIGGDTLITFGPRLVPSAVDGAGRLLREGSVDPDFADCVDGGRPCYLAARDAVRGKTIRQVYGYAVNELFGPVLLRCPGLDRRIESRGRVYYRLLLGGSCDDSAYDLVLVATDGDGVGNLLAEAATLGMKVFPGLPAAPQDIARPWLPDLAHLTALDRLTERVLSDYRQRYAASPAFGGVYQSFELAMKDRPRSDPTLALYTAQHAVVAAALPGGKILVSPYFDARRTHGFPPGQVARGLEEIAATRAGAPMAIAAQDGRGTGKAPVYGADESDARVDPRLAPMVGDVTNRQAYYGPTRDYFAAAASRPLPGVELWANVESFEPTQVAGECGRADPLPLRGRTAKGRIDRQVAAAAPFTSKIISYGWDPFFTCQDGFARPSLSDTLASGWNEPIIVDASRKSVDGRDGIAVEGYNLKGGTLRVTYQGKSVTAPLEQRGGHAWAPFAFGDAGGAWISVAATNGAGRSSRSGYVMR